MAENEHNAAVAKFAQVFQRQFTADIEAVKSGALDEELLRIRLMREIQESKKIDGPYIQMYLWLGSLALNLIDDLSVIVSVAEDSIAVDFIPQWNERRSSRTPILLLVPPGPAPMGAPAERPAQGVAESGLQIASVG